MPLLINNESEVVKITPGHSGLTATVLLAYTLISFQAIADEPLLLAHHSSNHIGNGSTTHEDINLFELQKNNAVIREIIITRGNVFNLSNPEENVALYRFANSIHIMTQKTVIMNLLLFKPGDVYSERLLEESERLLRNTKFLFDAHIRPFHYDSAKNVVDIEIITRDTWTLTGSINFSREGGDNAYSIELAESNLLGYGKELEFSWGANVDRDETSIGYKDNQVLGSRNQLSAFYADKSDGVTKYLSIQRPFFSLNTTWSLGFEIRDDERIDSLYDEGDVFEEFDHKEEYINFFWGLSEGYFQKHVYRWKFGFTKQFDKFESNDDTVTLESVPANRDIRYPWVGVEVFEDRLIKTKRIRQINRTEDLNLGNEIQAKLGWSDEHFSADDDGLIYSFNAKSAYQPFNKHLFFLNPYVDGRYMDDQFQNMIIGFGSRYYWPMFDDQIFYFSLSGQYGRNLDLEQQILLGGDSGLRGYPLRFQDGDRKYLMTLEHRIYTTWHWFELFYVGGLVFYDIGRAWFPGDSVNGPTGTLRDAGFGLRLASSRASRGLIIHIDVAFPMDAKDSVDEWQLVLTTKDSF